MLFSYHIILSITLPGRISKPDWHAEMDAGAPGKDEQ